MQGVFAMLVLEMIAFLVLLVPLPLGVRTKLIKFISSTKTLEHIKYVFKIFFIIVCVLFADSFNRSFKTQEARMCVT